MIDPVKLKNARKEINNDLGQFLKNCPYPFPYDTWHDWENGRAQPRKSKHPQILENVNALKNNAFGSVRRVKELSMEDLMGKE